VIEIRAARPNDRAAIQEVHTRAFDGPPVAVLPERQRQGIGSKLIREGLKQCKQAGYDAVVLLGYPAYYSRFGFSRAADAGLQNEYGVHDEFMVLALRDGALNGVSGLVKYLPEFGEAEC
jgi:putative acetyltransferase